MSKVYKGDLELPLKLFLEVFQLPQTVKVTGGTYDPQNADLDFANGEVLHLQRKVCKDLQLNFKKGRSMISVSVSPSHQARFQLVRYDPRRALMRGDGIKFSTVRELAEAAPLLVRAGRTYIHPAQPQTGFKAGDTIRLLRLAWRDGVQCLECRVQRSSGIVRLPMDCRGDFEIIHDSQYYTLQELIHSLPRNRCLRLAPDIINERYRIPGVPSGFTGELFLQRPTFLVSANSVDSPGQKVMIPEKLEVTVSPREDTYMGHLENEYLLEPFALDNKSAFPLEVKVTNWEEQSALMEAFSVRPGSVLTLHELKTIPKYLLKMDSQHYVVPHDFEAKFVKLPRTFHSIADLVHLDSIVIRVVKGAQPHESDFHGTVTGSVLKLKTGKPEVRSFTKDGRFKDETEVLQMTEVGASDSHVMNVPLYLEGTYEEVLQDSKGLTLSEAIENDVTDLAMMTNELDAAELATSSGGLPVKMRVIPTRMCGFVQEPYVLVSTSTDYGKDVSFHLPIRTKIYLRLLRRLKDALALMTKEADQIMESVTGEAFQKLQQQAGNLYSVLDEKKPPPLPLPPRRQKGKTVPPSTAWTRKAPVSPPQGCQSDPSSSNQKAAVQQHLKQKKHPPRPPTQKQPSSKSDESYGYEDVSNWRYHPEKGS